MEMSGRDKAYFLISAMMVAMLALTTNLSVQFIVAYAVVCFASCAARWRLALAYKKKMKRKERIRHLENLASIYRNFVR